MFTIMFNCYNTRSYIILCPGKNRLPWNPSDQMVETRHDVKLMTMIPNADEAKYNITDLYNNKAL